MHDEDNVMNFFTHVHMAGEYSTGNFWCTQSRIKSCLMVQFRLDISTYPLLRKLLIKAVSQHAKTKADVFPKGIINNALQEMDGNDPM